MLLKSALIREGFAVAKGKPEDGYVWGHDLEKLAKLLGSKRQDFSLEVSPRLARFDAFFNELRKSWSTVRVSDNVIEAIWNALVDAIRLERMRLTEQDDSVERAVEDYCWGV